jgi:carbonic anhydrase
MCLECDNSAVSRRHVLTGAVALLAAGTSMTTSADAQPVSAAKTPDDALKLLMDGNARYVANTPRERDFSAGRVSRTAGQAPFAAILGCSDSRVAPEFAFDQSPGDLFVVRVAGNFLTPDGLGSLEYGCAVLGTKIIMVLGHSSCGAVNATVSALQKGNALPGDIAGIARAMKPGIAPVLKDKGPDLDKRAVIANVRYNLERLKGAKAVLEPMIAKRQIQVVGGVYDLATGRVELV